VCPPVNRALSFATVAVVAVALTSCSGNSTTDNFTINHTLVNGKPGFSIATVTATKGDKVDVRVNNLLPATHGFSIDGYGIQRVVPSHASQEFTFTATKAGEFRIYCQLHPAHQPARLLVV